MNNRTAADWVKLDEDDARQDVSDLGLEFATPFQFDKIARINFRSGITIWNHITYAEMRSALAELCGIEETIDERRESRLSKYKPAFKSEHENTRKPQ